MIAGNLTHPQSTVAKRISRWCSTSTKHTTYDENCMNEISITLHGEEPALRKELDDWAKTQGVHTKTQLTPAGNLRIKIPAAKLGKIECALKTFSALHTATIGSARGKSAPPRLIFGSALARARESEGKVLVACTPARVIGRGTAS